MLKFVKNYFIRSSYSFICELFVFTARSNLIRKGKSHFFFLGHSAAMNFLMLATNSSPELLHTPVLISSSTPYYNCLAAFLRQGNLFSGTFILNLTAASYEKRIVIIIRNMLVSFVIMSIALRAQCRLTVSPFEAQLVIMVLFC